MLESGPNLSGVRCCWLHDQRLGGEDFFHLSRQLAQAGAASLTTGAVLVLSAVAAWFS